MAAILRCVNRPCRRRRAIPAPLPAVVALLLGLTGTAPAAFNPSATEAPLDDFLLWQSETSGFVPPEPADPSREIGVWVYDGASAVPVYVRQNPWTYYDPYGLNGFGDFAVGAWNELSGQANAIGHDLASVGVLGEIACQETGNAAAGLWGGRVNTEAGWDHLQALADHKESYAAEIRGGMAEVTGADTGSASYKAGGYTVVAAEVAAGGAAVAKNVKNAARAFKEGYREGRRAVSAASRASAGTSAETGAASASIEGQSARTVAEGGAPKTGGKPRVSKLEPVQDASGPHTSFKTNQQGKITGYETYDKNPHTGQFGAEKRFRGEGGPHGGVEPPFVLERAAGKGPGSKPVVPRSTTPEELPNGY